jgi:hypothetical protein
MAYGRGKSALLAAVGSGAALGQRLVRQYPNQRELISNLRNEEEWLLIILDACRYDFFTNVWEEFFQGDARAVWSSGRNTFEYIRTAWPDEYPEISYLSAAPVVNANERRDESEEALEMFRGYIASEHIPNIKELFKHEVADDIGTCPPEIVTQKALETRADKMVVHYFQPHAPYIGDERLVMRNADGESDTKLIWDAVRNGEIDLKQVQSAYESNLERVMHTTAKLIDYTDYDNVILTSDHGEALGEYNVFSHPDKIPYHPKTRVVPWAKIDAVRDYDEWEFESEARDTTKSVEERLGQLGYL